MTKLPARINYAIITISDRCSKDEAKDLSAPAIIDSLASNSCIGYSIVSDEKSEIQHKFLELVLQKIPLIILTGGTGLTKRDNTREALEPLFDKELPSFATAIITQCSEITKMAILSQPFAGIRDSSLFIALPGSPKAVKECLSAIKDCLAHAVDLICDHKASHPTGDLSNPLKFHSDSCCNFKDRNPERGSKFQAISFDEAMDLVLQDTSRFVNLENIENCVFKKSAESINSPIGVPQKDCSIVDGYALSDSFVKGTLLNCFDSVINAEDCESHPISASSTIRINTGANIPENCKCVIKVEDTRETDGMIELLKDMNLGENIRKAGSDIEQGALLIEKDALLDIGSVSLLASVGISQIKVYSPRIALFSTGSELSDSASATTGKVFDCNRIALKILLKEFQVLDLGIIPDEYETIKDALSEALKNADIVISSGGVSMGTKDFVKPAIQELGGEIVFGRVKMKPGLPTTFATFQNGSKLFFGLPGNPVSCLTTFHCLVVPCIRKSAFLSQISYDEEIMLNSEDIMTDEREEFKRVRITKDQRGQKIAIVNGPQQSSRMRSYQHTDGLLRLPSNHKIEVIKKGTLVKVSILPHSILRNK